RRAAVGPPPRAGAAVRADARSRLLAVGLVARLLRRRVPRAARHRRAGRDRSIGPVRADTRADRDTRRSAARSGRRPAPESFARRLLAPRDAQRRRACCDARAGLQRTVAVVRDAIPPKGGSYTVRSFRLQAELTARAAVSPSASRYGSDTVL